MRYRSFLQIILLSSLLLSCVDDDSESGGVAIPDVSISGSNSSTMQVVSVDLGQTCTITPDLIFANGCQASDLKYEWSVGTYNTESGSKGNLEKVSTEPVFSYIFPEGGSYYVHLKVNNGLSGDVIDYQVNVDSYFEEGIVIAAIDESGKGNVSFIKTLSEDEIAAGKVQNVLEHCVASMNEDIDMTGLLGAGTTMLAYGSSVRSFIVALKDKAYLLDPSTFALRSTSNYSEAIEGFEASSFFMYDYYGAQPTAFDKTKKRMIQIQREFGYAFVPTTLPAYQNEYDALIPGYTYFTSRDWYMSSPIFINYSTSELTNIGNSALTWTLTDRTILSAFKNTVQNSPDLYCIALDENDPNIVYQVNCNYEYNEDWSIKMVYKEMSHTIAPGEVLPEKGSEFCYDKTFLTCYYIVDGKLYAYFPLNTTLSFPTSPVLALNGEQITSVSLNEASKELYVGAYNTSTKRGSVYIYSSDAMKTNPQPKKSFVSCTDKVLSISYKKRSL